MKLAEALRIVQTPQPPNAEKFSVYLACGIFPLHLSTFLAAHLRTCLPDRTIEIHTGLYGDLTGNLAELQKSSPQAGAVIVEWSDLDPRLGLRRLGGWGPSVLPDIQTGVHRETELLLHLIEDAAQSTPLAVCLPTIPLPPIFNQPSQQFGLEHLQLETTLNEFAVRAAQITGVKILNRQRLDAVSLPSERLDVQSELSTGFPYRTAHASRVAELLAGLIQPRQPKKGLITDLDDTLWRGLLDELGARGVSWELDQRSHIHALYQQLLQALSESGILLGVASKNEPGLVAEALARQDLLLKANRIFPVEVNWGLKSQSVGRILAAWNIGADAVVFVDDSPMELAEVKSIYPAMECLRFPTNLEQEAYNLLRELRDLFGRQAILEEDQIRTASVRSGSQFHQQTQSEAAQPLEDFLGQVKAELTVGLVPSAKEPRAFELVNKTNQFNLNGRRLDDAEFEAALNRAGAVSLLVSYQDKYGPLGRIAVLLGQLESSVLKLDTWVMSCRAFSRQIEHRCLQYLFESLDVSEIELEFRQTPRNRPICEFLANFADTESTTPIRIQRDIFMSRKPRLSHKINEVSYA